MRISFRGAILATAAIAVPGLIGFSALPAGAATRAVNVRVVAVPLNSSTAKAKIVGEGKTAVYNPTALSVPEDTTGGDCQDGFTSFKIKNTGTADAYVTVNNNPFFPLAAGATAGICIDGGQPGDQETFGLANKKGTKFYSASLLITYSS
jgi:hypothetical protein